MFLFIQKYYPENFAFLILRILELYTRKVCEMFTNIQKQYNMLKSRLIFKILWVNNSIILRIKNEKLLEYYF